MFSYSVVKFGPRTSENRPEKIPYPLKLQDESVPNRQLYSAVRWPVAVNYGVMKRQRVAEVAELLKFTSGRNQNCPCIPFGAKFEFQFRHHFALRHLHFETEQDT